MTFFALAIGGYAITVVFVPTVGAPFIRDRLATIPVPMLGHMFLGGIALAVGAFQFNTKLRNYHRAVHRALGRVYVVAVFGSGLTALVLASVSQGGMVAHLGFGMLGIAWLITTSTAFKMIRRVNVPAHREWMIRSYALTLAAVTLRIYIPASLIAGIPFDTAYPVISWACWVPNLIVAELIIFAGQEHSSVRAITDQ